MNRRENPDQLFPPAVDKGLERKISNLEISREAAMSFLDSIEGIQGTVKFYSREKLKDYVNRVLSDEEFDPQHLPRTGGFREYIEKILKK